MQNPRETVFINGMDYFNALLSDIQQACHSIDIETYIFEHDIVGDRVVESLCAAADRGVQIRLMIDGLGTPAWNDSYANTLEQHGIQTQLFHAFPWQWWDWKRTAINQPKLIKWIYLLANINKRTHRKMSIIDKHIAYIGSCNISKKHIPKDMGGHGWRDMTVRLSNINLDDLQNAFNYTWDHFPLKERIHQSFTPPSQQSPFRLNYSRHQRRLLYKDLLKRIMKAKQRIWITNAYFVPDNFLLKALTIAAENRVDVCILLPKKSDVFIMPWASETFYRSLIESGIQIFEYLPSVLHAKTLVIDNWVLIGSSNLNHRSLLHDLEVDVCLQSDPAKQVVYQQFSNDLQHAQRVSIKQWKKRRWYRRLFGHLALYIKYIL